MNCGFCFTLSCNNNNNQRILRMRYRNILFDSRQFTNTPNYSQRNQITVRRPLFNLRPSLFLHLYRRCIAMINHLIGIAIIPLIERILFGGTCDTCTRTWPTGYVPICTCRNKNQCWITLFQKIIKITYRTVGRLVVSWSLEFHWRKSCSLRTEQPRSIGWRCRMTNVFVSILLLKKLQFAVQVIIDNGRSRTITN